MIYRKKAKVWVNSSGTNRFEVESETAYSYGWWKYVARIGTYLVFNEYSYSNTTSKHQSEVRGLLGRLGLVVDYSIQAPNGLQDLVGAEKHYLKLIESIQAKLNSPRTRASTNAARLVVLERLVGELKITRRLLSAVSGAKVGLPNAA